MSAPAVNATRPLLETHDLGRAPYARAFERQQHELARVLSWRESADPRAGVLLLLEHDPPVITVSKRRGAMQHLLADDDRLRSAGVELAHTDRGGDITYHGPGQLVAYPILDLNRLALGLHAYMRALEQAVIDTCAAFALPATREPGMTGVWTASSPPAKIAALGVRVRRWVSMHGLALNVTTSLDHFDLIVPCGLAGKSVTSLQRELGPSCPEMPRVKAQLAAALARAVGARTET